MPAAIVASSLLQLGEDEGDAERMEDEVLAAPALLVLVGLRREVVRPLQQVPVDVGVVGRHLGHELVELLAVPLGGRDEHLTRHEPILAPAPGLRPPFEAGGRRNPRLREKCSRGAASQSSPGIDHSEPEGKPNGR